MAPALTPSRWSAPTFSGPAAIVSNGTGSGAVTTGNVVLTGPSTLSVINTSSSQLTLGTITSPNAGANVSLIFGGSSTATIAPAAITFSQPANITLLAGGPTVTTTGLLTLAGYGPSTITNNSTNTLTFGALTTGQNQVTFAGSGSITVSGTTTVTEPGMLAAAGGSVTLANPVAAAVGYIGNTGTGTLTISGALTGDDVIFFGNGPINVTGGQSSVGTNANFNTGTTTISGGALNIATAITPSWSNFSSSALIISANITTGITGAGITFTGTGTVNVSGSFQPTGTMAIAMNNALSTLILGGTNNTTASTLTLTAGMIEFSTAANLPTGAFTMAAGTVFNNIAAASTGTIALSQAITLTASTINVTNTGNTVQFASTSIGGITTTFSGAGAVNLQAVTVSATGAVFNNNSSAVAGLNIATITGTATAITFEGSGNTKVTGVIGTTTGAVVINGAGVNLGSSSLLNTASGAGLNAGAGTATFGSTANTFSGGTTITAGTLVGAAAAGSSGTPFGTGAMAITNGVLQLNPASAATSTTTLAGLTVSAGATISIPNTISGGGAGATTVTFTTLTLPAVTAAVSPGALIINYGGPQADGGPLGADVIIKFNTTAPANANSVMSFAVAQTGASLSSDATFVNSGAVAGTALTAWGLTGGPTYTNFTSGSAGGATTVGSTSTSVATNASGTAFYALQVNSGAAISGTGTLSINSAGAALTPGAIILNGGSSISAPLTFGTSTGSIYVDGASTISNTIGGAATAGLSVFGPYTTAAAAGTNSLIGNYPGSLTLSGAVNFAGSIYVANANLIVAAASLPNNNEFVLRGSLTIAPTTAAGLHDDSSTIVAFNGGASIIANNPGNTTTFSGTMTWSAAGLPLVIQNQNSGTASTLTFSGAITGAATSNVVIVGVGNVSFTNSFTVSNLIMAGSGTLTLAPQVSMTTVVYANSGTTLLEGTTSLTPTATLNINGGTVKFGSANGQQVSGLVTINPSSGGTLDLADYSGSIGSLAGAQTVGSNIGLITNSGTTAATLVIAGSVSGTYFGNIQDGAGQVNLMIGTDLATSGGNARTITLGGNNTYTGTTTILSQLGNGISLQVAGANALLNTTVINDSLATANALLFVAIYNGVNYTNLFTVGGLAGFGNTAFTGTYTVTTVNFGNNNQNTTYAGSFSFTSDGGASQVAIAKIGTGVWQIANISSAYNGMFNVNAGTAQLLIPNAFGIPVSAATAVPATVAAGGTLDLYSLDQTFSSIAGGGIIITGNNPFNSLNISGLTGPSNSNFSGVISGGGGLDKLSGSTSQMFLTGFNTYTGPTIVNEGNLQLSFTNLAGSTSNIISSSSPVVLAANITGATTATVLTIVASNAPSSSNSQTFNGVYATNSTTVTSVATSLAMTNSNGSGSLSVSLGSMNTQTGAQINITMPSAGANSLSLGALNRSYGSAVNITIPTVSASNTLTTTTTGTAGNIVTDGNGTAFMVLNGVDWAAYKNSTTIVPGSTISNFYNPAYTTASAPGANWDITASGSAYSVSNNVIANSIRFNIAAGGLTATLPSGTTTLTTGGILQTSVTGATNILTGGTLISTTGELYIDNAAAHTLVVGATLTNNNTPGNNTNLTIAGTAGVYLSADNPYTGATTILNGTTLILGDNGLTGSINHTSALIINGILTFANTSPSDVNFASTSISGTGSINVSNFVNSTAITATFGSGNITLGGALIVGTTEANGTATFGGNGPDRRAARLPVAGGNSSSIIGAATFNGTFASTAAAGIQVGAAGGTTNSVTLNGTYSAGSMTTTGTTIITTGTLTFGTQSAATYALQSSNTTISAAQGLVFAMGVTTASIGGLVGANAITETLLNGATQTGSAVTLYVGGANAASTWAGALAGSGAGLVKTGTGVTTFTGANTYTGATQLSSPTNAGILVLAPSATTSTGVLYNGVGSTGSAGNLIMGGSQYNSNGGSSPTIGSLSLTGTTGGTFTFTQYFNQLTLSPNTADVINFTAPAVAGTSTISLNIGSISRSTLGSGATANSGTGSALYFSPLTASGSTSGTVTATINVSSFPVNANSATSSAYSNSSGQLLVDASGTAFALMGGALGATPNTSLYNAPDWAAIKSGQIVTGTTANIYTSNGSGSGVNTDIASSYTLASNTIGSISNVGGAGVSTWPRLLCFQGPPTCKRAAFCRPA